MYTSPRIFILSLWHDKRLFEPSPQKSMRLPDDRLPVGEVSQLVNSVRQATRTILFLRSTTHLNKE